MIATEKQKLPKLQFGEGTLAYTDTGTIAYKKYVELSDGSKVRKHYNIQSILNSMIITAHAEDIINTFEMLGFERKHEKTAIDEM